MKKVKSKAQIKKVNTKGIKNKFFINQQVVSNNGVPATVVSIILTPESATSSGNKITEPLLYQVRDSEGSQANVDRTVVEAGIFKEFSDYKVARCKELNKELSELSKK